MNPETINLENSVGPSFELMQDGSMFVPYGDFAHREGMQRFDREAAERMGEDLRGIFSQIRRVVRDGIARRAPIYIGHPDVPGRGAEFPDKRAYGWVTAVAAENDGMRLSIKWTSEGDRLVRDGHFAFYSPYWEADEVGAGRSRVLRPMKLISVGLTNNPNIPVPALANEAAGEDDESNPDDDMKKELAEMLGKDDTTSEGDLLAEVKRLLDAAAAEADDDAQEDDDAEADADDEKAGREKADGEGEGKKEEEESDAAKKAAAENDALLASIRTERIGMALDSLCLAGRLTVADRPAASQRLAACANDADFAATLNEMSTAAPALKTQGLTDGLAEDGASVKAENDLAAIKQKRGELIDAEMKRNGGNFSAAWAKCSRAKPELFT